MSEHLAFVSITPAATLRVEQILQLGKQILETCNMQFVGLQLVDLTAATNVLRVSLLS